jgi:hypothetical protein
VTSGTTTIFALPTFSVMVGSGINEGGFFRPDTNTNPALITDYLPQGNAGTFSLTGDQLIIASGTYTGRTIVQAPTINNQDPDLTYVSGTLDASLTTPLSCSVSQNADGRCPLTCVNFAGDNQSFDCGSYWRVGKPSDINTGGCWFYTPYVVGQTL